MNAGALAVALPPAGLFVAALLLVQSLAAAVAAGRGMESAGAAGAALACGLAAGLLALARGRRTPAELCALAALPLLAAGLAAHAAAALPLDLHAGTADRPPELLAVLTTAFAVLAFALPLVVARGGLHAAAVVLLTAALAFESAWHGAPFAFTAALGATLLLLAAPEARWPGTHPVYAAFLALLLAVSAARGGDDVFLAAAQGSLVLLVLSAAERNSALRAAGAAALAAALTFLALLIVRALSIREWTNVVDFLGPFLSRHEAVARAFGVGMTVLLALGVIRRVPLAAALFAAALVEIVLRAPAVRDGVLPRFTPLLLLLAVAARAADFGSARPAKWLTGGIAAAVLACAAAPLLAGRAGPPTFESESGSRGADYRSLTSRDFDSRRIFTFKAMGPLGRVRDLRRFGLESLGAGNADEAHRLLTRALRVLLSLPDSPEAREVALDLAAAFVALGEDVPLRSVYADDVERLAERAGEGPLLHEFRAALLEGLGLEARAADARRWRDDGGV